MVIGAWIAIHIRNSAKFFRTWNSASLSPVFPPAVSPVVCTSPSCRSCFSYPSLHPFFFSLLSLFLSFSRSLFVSILEFTVEYYHHCCYHRSINRVDRSRQRWPRSRKSNERSGDFCAPTRLSAWMIWILRLVLVRTLNHGKVVYPSAEIALFGFRNRPVAQPIARFQVFSLPLSLLLFLIFVTCPLSLSLSLYLSFLFFIIRFSSHFFSRFRSLLFFLPLFLAPRSIDNYPG